MDAGYISGNGAWMKTGIYSGSIAGSIVGASFESSCTKNLTSYYPNVNPAYTSSTRSKFVKYCQMFGAVAGYRFGKIAGNPAGQKGGSDAGARAGFDAGLKA